MAGLTAKFSFIVLAALVPILAFQIYNETQARAVRQQLTEDEGLRLLLLVRAEQQRIIEGAEQVVSVLAHTSAVRDQAPANCQRLMASLLHEQTRYVFAGVISLDGTLICSPEMTDTKVNVADRPYFNRALQSGGFTVGEFASGGVSGKPSLHVARPFRNRDENVAGVVDVAISLEWLNEQLAKSSLPADSVVAIGDRNGVILARNPAGLAFAGRAQPPDRSFLMQGDHIQAVHDVAALDTGRGKFVTYSPPGADRHGLMVAVSLDEETAFAASTRANRLGLELIVAGTLLALALSVVLGRRMIRGPVAELIDAADQWRAGALNVRTRLRPRRDEFGRLAQAFDMMAETLEARERALHTSEERFRGLVNAASNVLYAMSPDWAEMRQLADDGVLSGTARPSTTWLADYIYPDDQPTVLAAIQVAVSTKAVFDLEHRVRRADGSSGWTHSRAVPLLDAGGQIREWFGSASDVTARKRAEAELAHLNQILEERVCTEIAAREAAQGQAAHAQRMQALGQLAGGIAHDFNNILQAMQGAGGLIEARATDPVRVRRFARVVMDAAERGAAITRRLLTFSRRGTLVAERIDAAELLDGLQDVLTHTLGSPITVRLEASPGLPALLADRGQLETVLVNLATNARDAMPDGGTVILSATPAEQAHPAGLKPSRYLRLTVTDTGTGMDGATLERAIEPFFTTKAQDKGTGLGLSMAKGFAEQSGGALTIESAPGQGTAVTLWLPVADELTETGPMRGSASRGDGVALRVLVVDDDDLVRETMAMQLEELDLEVMVASNGTEAVALLAQEQVDALVTDLSMPGMNGVRMIEKAHALHPGLPCFLLTGYAGERAALAAGDAFTLVRKPVSAERLVAQIEAALEVGRGNRA